MNSTLSARIIDLAAAVFGVPANMLDPQSSPDTVDQWDSLAHLALMVAIEQEFGIRVEPDESEGIGTLGDCCGVVERKLGEPGD